MTIRALLKTGGLAALATAMAVTALPSAASARPGDGDQRAHGDRGDRGSRGGSDARSTGDRGDRGSRGDRGGRSADASPRGDGGSRGAWAPPVRTAPTAAPAPARVAERGPGRGGQWQGGARPGTDTRGPGTHDRNRDRDNHDRDNRNGDYRSGNHGGAWSGSNRDRSWNNGSRNGSWNNGSWNHGNHDRGDYRKWDHRWRDNSRYNWRDWRSSHRNTFHLGRYYSPYRNYSYRRLSIGFFLDSLFYSNNYWINDPWQYRLPEAYGPYRWVRYYDDALLVDIYSGEVVDVMYDFFW